MSAGDDIPLDAALIDAYRMGLEQGLNAGLSAAAEAVIADERKQEEAAAAAVETAVRSAIDDGVLKSFKDLKGDFDSILLPVEGVECTTDAVADFFYHAEQLARSRGFRRLSVRYMVRKGDDEICYEVDGDVYLTPDP